MHKWITALIAMCIALLMVVPLAAIAHGSGTTTFANGETIIVPNADRSIVSALSSFPNVQVVQSIHSGSGIFVIGQGYLAAQSNNLGSIFKNDMAADYNVMFIVIGAQNERSSVMSSWYSPEQALFNAGMTNSANKSAPAYAIPASPAFALTFNPNGLYQFASATDIVSYINGFVSQFADRPAQTMISYFSVPGARSYDLTQGAFTFAYNTAWLDVNLYQSGYKVGWLNYMVAYYETQQTTGSGTYYFFLAYTTTSAQGNWYLPWANWLPINFHSTTNWNTQQWAGQQLYDWGPKESGSGATVTFSLSAGTGGLSAGVSFSAPSPDWFSWTDQSQPSNGIAKTWFEAWTLTSLDGTTLTVQPSSVGEINPTLAGGYLPMVVNQYSAADQGSGTPQLYASFQVGLYSNWGYTTSSSTGVGTA